MNPEISGTSSVRNSRRRLPVADVSATSTSTYSFNSFSQNRLLPLGSVKVIAKNFARIFVTCFIPWRKGARGIALEADLYPVEEDSVSTNQKAISNTNSFQKFKYSTSHGPKSAELGRTRFSAADIYTATKNFSEANKIGGGGFGNVYKGRLEDGSVIAVKRAKKQNMYDKRLAAEFKNEIKTLSKVEHLNLVRFLGYLEDNGEQMVVVEYVANGTLREHLDGSRGAGSDGTGLDLAQRLDIAIDVAHAITYLHMYIDQPIIHRDIKATNILITEKLRAKVADFGFARLATDDPGATHISTQVKGTSGYLDPEYLRTYQLTEKSDVYSFGVLLVELMTGRHPIEPKRELKERVTTRWAMKKLKEGDVIVVMDPRLRRSSAANASVEKVLEMAEECMAPSRRWRPSMKKCAEMLWEIRRDYHEMEFSSSSSLRSASYKNI